MKSGWYANCDRGGMATTFEKKFSLSSIASIVFAILSFQFGAILGLLFAILAILAGCLGAVLALSPRVRGGVMSTLALLMGFVGVIAAIVKVFI